MTASVFTVTSLGSWGDTTGRSTATCPISRAPNPNSLVVVSVLVSDGAGTPVQPTSVLGAGLVFSLITSSISFDFKSAGSQTHNLSVWRSMASAGLNGSMITASFPNTNIGAAMLVTEISGVSTSGTSGSGAVGKSATTSNDNNSSVTCFAPSATSTANAWLAIGGVGDSGGVVWRQSYLSLDFVGYGTPSSGLASAWTTKSTSTMVAMGDSAFDQRAVTMIELVLDNPASPPSSESSSGGTTSGSTAAQNPTHKYAAAGTYIVKLTVYDNNNLSSSTTGAVTVT